MDTDCLILKFSIIFIIFKMDFHIDVFKLYWYYLIIGSLEIMVYNVGYITVSNDVLTMVYNTYETMA